MTLKEQKLLFSNLKKTNRDETPTIPIYNNSYQKLKKTLSKVVDSFYFNQKKIQLQLTSNNFHKKL